ncbi:type II and III secretion system protein [Xanthocytophaga agilis]|uniref:Type II and III secretion system protein n=1 Tax=Xanthocytophaga agilis TaxID=3048010 RepID=A0AAE3R4I4_9BACT|nr:type II and III secretion system protein [Xanthocytophaga agilis]MDJ1501249.1 type II and III secretion system protein [Xanthocytophaga agilis]
MKPALLPKKLFTRKLLTEKLYTGILSLLLILLYSLVATSLQAQDPNRIRQEREKYLFQVENQLRALSDSLVPGLREVASLTVSEASLGDFLRGLAQTHRLNISVEPGLDNKVTNNFTGVKVQDLLLFLCREYNLDIRFTGTIMAFSRYQPPAEPKPTPQVRIPQIQYDISNDRLVADLANDSLPAVARQLTRLSKKNVVLAPGLNGKMVSSYIEGMPLEAGLDKIAYANGLRLVKTSDNAYLLEGNDSPAAASGSRNRLGQNGLVSAGYPSNRQGNGGGGGNNADNLFIDVKQGPDGNQWLTVDASGVPIVDIINEASSRLNINYVLFSNLPGNTTVRLQNVRYDDLLSFLLQGTSHTMKRMDGIYLIGERNLEGFRNTRLVKMQFRPADKIDEVIPPELKKGVDIKIFKELNSVILSGGLPQIEEITNFLKAIDQPVLNVLIEVIVMEVNKSFSVETGISALLSDSTKKTGGTVFPGLDMTIGSGAINKFLSTLSSNGLVNIGRVTPNFYLQLKALEQNSNVQVHSTPKLSTLNGHEATLTIGQSVYYLEQTQNITGSVTTTTSVTQRYNKVNADMSIKINPMVSGDEHITLDINAEFSDFTAPTIAGAPPGNATRKFTSMIRIKNEEMIILGGLEEARKSASGSGVPILSRIPILKWLFSSRKRERSDKRLLIFIKPTLMY